MHAIYRRRDTVEGEHFYGQVPSKHGAETENAERARTGSEGRAHDVVVVDNAKSPGFISVFANRTQLGEQPFEGGVGGVAAIAQQNGGGGAVGVAGNFSREQGENLGRTKVVRGDVLMGGKYDGIGSDGQGDEAEGGFGGRQRAGDHSDVDGAVGSGANSTGGTDAGLDEDAGRAAGSGPSAGEAGSEGGHGAGASEPDRGGVDGRNGSECRSGSGRRRITSHEEGQKREQ